MIENAKWISAGEKEQAPCIIKKFNIENAKNATLDITGLGYFSVKLNGKRITKDLFTPVFSDYRERSFDNLLYPISDKMTHRVYFCRYDIGKFIKNGENTLSVCLGNGWYRQNKRTAEGHLEFGQSLITKFSLRYINGCGKEEEIVSDGSELWTSTEVTENNIFYGEVHDARRLDKKRKFNRVTAEEEFPTIYSLQTCPAERVIRKITPKLINEIDGSKIYDVGETVSGYVKVRATGKSGDEITVNHGEMLTADNTLDVTTVGGKIENDRGEKQLQLMRYISDGKKRIFKPKFSRQAFRYFEITGNAEVVSVEVVHTALEERTTFECDNSVLSWLYDAFKRTQIMNMHDGFPSDCPHRERLGYTGDGQITASAAMTYFESEEFYRKWIRDICDCQNVNNGHVQHTAPFYGGGGGPVGWGGAIVEVPYAFYRHYGDKSIIRETFPYMLKWIDYIVSRSENGLVCREENGGWCLGDWAAIDEMTIPQEFVNTTLFIRFLQRMIYLAVEIGGYDKEIGKIKDLLTVYKNGVVDRYFDDKTHSFCGGVQGADAFALSADLGDETTLDNLVGRYSEKRYFDTGFLGTYILIETLIDKGYENLAFDLLSSKKKGSFGYLQKRGETTIWEYIANEWGSHCHPMFGAAAEFLMSSLLGFPVNQTKKTFVLHPVFPDCVKNAKGSMSILSKNIKIEWKRKNNAVCYRVFVPDDFKLSVKYKSFEIELKKGKNEIKIVL